MIAWESDMAKALARGKAEQKCVLLEFFSPECIGCQQMDAVTFSDSNVENFMTDRVVALHSPVGSNPLASDFRVVWTPTLIVLDFYGKEHQRTIGFLGPDELVPSLILGVAKTALDNGFYNESVLQLNTLLNGYPKSAVAPEAVYLRGVSRYLSSHAPGALKESYQQLSAEYPQSEWTRRAQPYTLL
jgi:hypothetical protein